jgi:hypothetical protein
VQEAKQDDYYNPGFGEREHDAPEGAKYRNAVYPGSFFQFPWNRVKKALSQPNAQRNGSDEMGYGDASQFPEKVVPFHQEKQRDR